MRVEKVIACIDGSSSSTAVCDAAAWAAKSLGAPLLLLHVLEKSPTPSTDNLSGSIGLGSREKLLEELTALDEQRSKLALEHGRALLEKARQRAETEGVAGIIVKQRHGDMLDTLRDLETETRLIVLGRSGEDHEAMENAIGSHLESVARIIPKPLLITVGDFTAPKNFMIAYDGRETADRAIARIASSPLLKGIPCHIVMVEDGSEGQNERLKKAENILRSEGFEVFAHLIGGEIFPVLKTYKDTYKIDILAMGAFEHSRVRQFFVGSNTTKMISGSDVPLMILR